MTEYIQLLLTLCAVLIVLLGLLALMVRFILAPLAALCAIPTYAAMIVLEYVISQHSGGKCPKLLQLSRPKTFWKRLSMDFPASYCTLFGALIAMQLFDGYRVGQSPDARFAYLIAHASDSGQFLLIALFWIFLVGTYAISRFHTDREDHPLNKLEDLVFPEWAKKLVEKVTK